MHLRWRHKSGLDWYLDNHNDTIFVVPIRDREKIVNSIEDRQWCEMEFFAVFDALYARLFEYGAHFINVEKYDGSEQELKYLVWRLGLPWTPKMQKFLEDWPVIGKGGSRSTSDRDLLNSLPPERDIRKPRVQSTAQTIEIE